LRRNDGEAEFRIRDRSRALEDHPHVREFPPSEILLGDPEIESTNVVLHHVATLDQMVEVLD
jgi:hypothetical protein